MGFNCFDLVLVALLAFGFWRGRKNGMTKEILPAIQWVVLVAACTLGYAWLGGLLIQWGVVKTCSALLLRRQTARIRHRLSGHCAGCVYHLFLHQKCFSGKS